MAGPGYCMPDNCHGVIIILSWLINLNSALPGFCRIVGLRGGRRARDDSAVRRWCGSAGGVYGCMSMAGGIIVVVIRSGLSGCRCWAVSSIIIITAHGI